MFLPNAGRVNLARTPLPLVRVSPGKPPLVSVANLGPTPWFSLSTGSRKSILVPSSSTSPSVNNRISRPIIASRGEGAPLRCSTHRRSSSDFSWFSIWKKLRVQDQTLRRPEATSARLRDAVVQMVDSDAHALFVRYVNDNVYQDQFFHPPRGEMGFLSWFRRSSSNLSA